VAVALSVPHGRLSLQLALVAVLAKGKADGRRSEQMPRHGKVQQLLLAILRQYERKRSAQQRAEGLDEYRLACTAHRKRHPNLAEPVTSNEKRSVHRPLKALVREGAVLNVGAPPPLARQPRASAPAQTRRK
jgi:hypothetical protein